MSIWRTIPEFPNYELRGKKVRNKTTGYILKTFLHRGTLYVNFRAGGKRFCRSIKNLRDQTAMRDVEFYPILSSGGIYEMSKSGIVRNTESKHVLNPSKKSRLIFCINGKTVMRSIKSLQAEVFGSKAVKGCKMPVTLAKGNSVRVLASKKIAAEFLAKQTYYSFRTCYNQLIKRRREIYGWRVAYYEDDTRIAKFLRK